MSLAKARRSRFLGKSESLATAEADYGHGAIVKSLRFVLTGADAEEEFHRALAQVRIAPRVGVTASSDSAVFLTNSSDTAIII